MRKDMAKVIVERPRVGGTRARRKKGNHDLEELPQKQSMGRYVQFGWNAKQLNENLSPLKRYLNKNVGRPWNKIHSEISANLKLTNTVQKHVLDHLKQLVETNVHKKAGRVYQNVAHYRGEVRELNYQELYVDPETGYLRKYKFNRWTRKKYVTADRPAWQDAINTIIASAKGATVFKDEVIYKVYKRDGEEHYTPAMKHHAMLDFNSGMWSQRWRVQEGTDVWKNFFVKYAHSLPKKSGYFQKLADLAGVYFP